MVCLVHSFLKFHYNFSTFNEVDIKHSGFRSPGLHYTADNEIKRGSRTVALFQLNFYLKVMYLILIGNFKLLWGGVASM